ncbi:unnamed protein product [Dibothriocephalus latus]|uniref:Uncharacterized protein n=1 Tax=Dibothriocephalus latus TaxID=60516 RepID=A0A3P6RJF6_DIBLA|nr:unnamed protein product [Dibothriocephalus latus]
MSVAHATLPSVGASTPLARHVTARKIPVRPWRSPARVALQSFLMIVELLAHVRQSLRGLTAYENEQTVTLIRSMNRWGVERTKIP